MRAEATTTTDGPPAGPERALAERARAFDIALFERAADEVVRGDRHSRFRTPSLPHVPHLHGLVAHVPMEAAEAEALADEHGLRRLLPVDEALVEPLAARGWREDPVLLLGRAGELEPPAVDVPAEEVPYGHVRGLRDEWIRSEPWAEGEAERRDAHEADRRMFTATPTRAFATFEQGRPLAYALLLDGGRDGMLEDVYATPPARGRGLATSVIAAVLHAARAERREVVFVATDAVGGAGGLYERLGFEPLTVLHWLSRSRPPAG